MLCKKVLVISVSNDDLKAYYYNRESRLIKKPERRGIVSAEEKGLHAYEGNQKSDLVWESFILKAKNSVLRQITLSYFLLDPFKNFTLQPGH